MVILCLAFWGILKPNSRAAALYYIHISKVQNSDFSTSSPALAISWFFKIYTAMVAGMKGYFICFSFAFPVEMYKLFLLYHNQ
jgi:hypothetical protein